MKAVVHNSHLQANLLNRVLRYASSLLLESLLLRYLTELQSKDYVAALKKTNPELSAIRQQLEMYEGSNPTQSPFQAGGAMEELRRSVDGCEAQTVLVIYREVLEVTSAFSSE